MPETQIVRWGDRVVVVHVGRCSPAAAAATAAAEVAKRYPGPIGTRLSAASVHKHVPEAGRAAHDLLLRIDEAYEEAVSALRDTVGDESVTIRLLNTSGVTTRMASVDVARRSRD
eukprot:4109655-Prymnesium_polylepis.1